MNNMELYSIPRKTSEIYKAPRNLINTDQDLTSFKNETPPNKEETSKIKPKRIQQLIEYDQMSNFHTCVFKITKTPTPLFKK